MEPVEEKKESASEKEEKKEKPVLRAPQISYVDGKLQVNKGSLEVNLAEDDEELRSKGDGEGSKRGRRKKEKSEKWFQEETEKFYNALQIFGTDFSIIAKLLPGRTRKQIKNKFNKEERGNPEKIDLILKQASTYSMEDFQKCYGPVDNFASGAGDNEKFFKEKIEAHVGGTTPESKSVKSADQQQVQPKVTAVDVVSPAESKKEETKNLKINLFGNAPT